uniref:Paramyosin n=1 Tax=Macrostomum lignano TaxID=282301 RepID=A0A1I8ISG5_9PLAT
GVRARCCSIGCCVIKWLGVATLCIGTTATLFGPGGGGESHAPVQNQPPPQLPHRDSYPASIGSTVARLSHPDYTPASPTVLINRICDFENDRNSTVKIGTDAQIFDSKTDYKMAFKTATNSTGSIENRPEKVRIRATWKCWQVCFASSVSRVVESKSSSNGWKPPMLLTDIGSVGTPTKTAAGNDTQARRLDAVPFPPLVSDRLAFAVRMRRPCRDLTVARPSGRTLTAVTSSSTSPSCSGSSAPDCASFSQSASCFSSDTSVPGPSGSVCCATIGSSRPAAGSASSISDAQADTEFSSMAMLNHRLAVPIGGRFVRAVTQKQLRHLEAVNHAADHQGGELAIAGGVRQSGNGVGVVLGSDHQRRDGVSALHRHVGPSRQQEAGHLGVVVLAAPHQGSLAVLLVADVRVCPGLKEHLSSSAASQRSLNAVAISGVLRNSLSRSLTSAPAASICRIHALLLGPLLALLIRTAVQRQFLVRVAAVLPVWNVAEPAQAAVAPVQQTWQRRQLDISRQLLKVAAQPGYSQVGDSFSRLGEVFQRYGADKVNLSVFLASTHDEAVVMRHGRPVLVNSRPGPGLELALRQQRVTIRQSPIAKFLAKLARTEYFRSGARVGEATSTTEQFGLAFPPVDFGYHGWPRQLTETGHNIYDFQSGWTLLSQHQVDVGRVLEAPNLADAALKAIARGQLVGPHYLATLFNSQHLVVNRSSMSLLSRFSSFAFVLDLTVGSFLEALLLLPDLLQVLTLWTGQIGQKSHYGAERLHFRNLFSRQWGPGILIQRGGVAAGAAVSRREIRWSRSTELGPERRVVAEAARMPRSGRRRQQGREAGTEGGRGARRAPKAAGARGGRRRRQRRRWQQQGARRAPKAAAGRQAGAEGSSRGAQPDHTRGNRQSVAARVALVGPTRGPKGETPGATGWRADWADSCCGPRGTAVAAGLLGCGAAGLLLGCGAAVLPLQSAKAVGCQDRTGPTRTTEITMSSGGGSRSSRMESSTTTLSRQVYRGLSPNSQSRLETRIKELEDLLQFERDARVRSERVINEYNFQLESANERIEEADNIASQAQEAVRRRELDLQKVRKELEAANAQLESLEVSIKKKYTVNIAELNDEVDSLRKLKTRLEKEKTALLGELDNLGGQLDQAIKAKNTVESKLEGYDAQLSRLRAQNDELAGQLRSMQESQSRLQAENSQLQRAAHDAESQVSGLSKARSSLQAQLEEMKKTLDEESRSRSNLQTQFMTLQQEYYNLQSKYDEESEEAASLRVQINKLNSELTTLRSKYERDFVSRVEEFEEVKRKLTVKVTELEDVAERERSRANNMDRSRQQLLAELKALQGDTDALQAANAELASQVKQSEATVSQLTVRIEELTSESASLQATLQSQQAELAKLRKSLKSADDRIAQLERDNAQLAGSLKEANSANRDLTRRLADSDAARAEAEAARDSFASSLRDAEEAVRELTQKQAATADALARLRSDLETRLAEKESELESLRRSSQRTVEELQAALNDSDAKHKSEVNRLKKHLESTVLDLESQIDVANRANQNLAKENKTLLTRIQELEALLEDERRANEVSQGALSASEKRRSALQSELNELRTICETAERGRKKAESELQDVSVRISELTMQLQTSGNERRRLEGELASLRSELEDAQSGRAAELDRANRLAGEVQRLADELRAEQENYRVAEGLRRQLEIEIREVTVKLEESESLASRESKRIAQRLQERVRELEAELEAEQRRAREFQAVVKKMERQVKEALAQAEEERLVNIELHDLLGKAQLKIKAYKRQVEESEEASAAAISKYRKAQQVAEEAEHRAEVAERTMSVRSGGSGGTVIRSISVTREMNSSSSSGHKLSSRASNAV